MSVNPRLQYQGFPLHLGETGMETLMTLPEISGIAPRFIVSNVPAALAFYRDRLGFDITFQGPDPDDIFFGIVRSDRQKIAFHVAKTCSRLLPPLRISVSS